jgi:hypothetical protein
MSLVKTEMFGSPHWLSHFIFSHLVQFCVNAARTAATKFLQIIERTAARQKAIDMTARLTASAIMTEPHGRLDMGPVANAQAMQGPVIQSFEGGNRLSDLSLPLVRTVIRGSHRTSGEHRPAGLAFKVEQRLLHEKHHRVLRRAAYGEPTHEKIDHRRPERAALPRAVDISSLAMARRVVPTGKSVC